jgi:methyl-accepting chemotaxis protein
MGDRMLNRLTVAALLKAVIAVMAACVVAVLSVSAWSSWERLQEAGRVTAIADASATAFKAMHNLRNDRPSTNRLLILDSVIQPDMVDYLGTIRGDAISAMQATAERLPAIQFGDKETLIPVLSRLMQTLTALHAESWEAMSQPKASRRPALVQEYMGTSGALLQTLDSISVRLAAAVNHYDPMIDQLLAIKQAAWLLRSTSGEASLLLASGLTVGHMTPEARLNYARFVGGIETAWTGLEQLVAAGSAPKSLIDAMAMAKTANFDPQYLALRDRIANALLSGEKPELTASQWSPITVGRMGSAVTVAERALDEAKIRASALRSAAEQSLIFQLSLLAGALVLALVSMIALSRRVINPLHAIRDAMLQVAAGDLSVDAGYAERRDEIGALAGSLAVFKQQAIEKAQIEKQERDRNLGALARQRAIEAHIAAFEDQMRLALNALDTASDQMRTTSDDMTSVSNQTNKQVHTAAKAAGEASTNVQSVASASEELSTSIDDIGRQVAHAADIASRAVERARQTDDTVQGLSTTANRIGEVVGLINDIASQTNLLALNATIEAARAGQAGRGFAVVASEVKSLASQTASATEEISGQIAAVQKVALEAIEAIKGIGGIIGEVNEVASAIAAAVEQQGSATLEITRSTQQAAKGTKVVSDNINGVSVGADAAGAAAKNVKSAAEVLGAQAQQLRSQVDAFLGNIRAA